MGVKDAVMSSSQTLLEQVQEERSQKQMTLWDTSEKVAQQDFATVKLSLIWSKQQAWPYVSLWEERRQFKTHNRGATEQKKINRMDQNQDSWEQLFISSP